MYYLEDQHKEYEYACYCRVGDGVPYIKPRLFDSLSDIKKFIEEDIEKRHNRYHQIFYIDNAFYDNQYSVNQNGTYYKFLRRKISDWEDLDKATEQRDSNIIYYFV